jgi:hypothetical protein
MNVDLEEVEEGNGVALLYRPAVVVCDNDLE